MSSDKQTDLLKGFARTNDRTTPDNTGFSGGVSPQKNFTAEDLHALLNQGYTLVKAAQKLGIKRSRAYELKKKLEDSGKLAKTGRMTGQIVTSPPSPAARYRLHGVVLTVLVRHRGPEYLRFLQRSNVRFINGCRVTLGHKFIKVRGAADLMFWGVSPEDSHSQAEDWCVRFLTIVENQFKTVLIKHGSGFEFFYHLAEVGNGLAEESRLHREKIVVRGDNGKVWLITDNSFNLDEAETVESRRAGEDMERVVAPVFNNYRDYAEHLRLPSEQWAMHDRLAALVLEMADLQRQSHEQLVPLLAAQVEQAKVLNAELSRRVAAFDAVSSDFSELRRYTG